MNIFTEMGLFFKRRLLKMVRQPLWIYVTLSTPLMYVLLFAPLLKNVGPCPKTTAEVLSSFMPGLFVLVAFSVGSGGGWPILYELISGVLEWFCITPARRFSMIMGIVLGSITEFTVTILLLLTGSALLGVKVYPLGFMIMFLLLCLLTAGVSACFVSFALILKQNSSLGGVCGALSLPLMLLSGVFLPVSLAPKWLQYIAHFNPMYYAVEASRKLASGVICCSETWLAFAVVVPLTAISLTWSTNVSRKAVE